MRHSLRGMVATMMCVVTACSFEATAASQSSSLPGGGSSASWHVPWVHRPQIPPRLPSDQPTAWVTFFSTYGGCVEDPTEIAVSANPTDPCAMLLVTPGMDQGGDTFEVAADVSWSADDDGIVMMSPSQHGKRLDLSASADFFSLAAHLEPVTMLRYCASNHCPSTASSCEDRVCGSVRVRAVVSIAGAWQLNGSMVRFAQTGRSFVSEDGVIHDGVVQDDRVAFWWNGQRGDGVIDPSRAYLAGHLYDDHGVATSTWIAIR